MVTRKEQNKRRPDLSFKASFPESRRGLEFPESQSVRHLQGTGGGTFNSVQYQQSDYTKHDHVRVF